jgi:hypothetical protein
MLFAMIEERDGRGHVNNSIDQLGLFDLRQGVITSFKLLTGELLPMTQRRDRFGFSLRSRFDAHCSLLCFCHR